MTKDKEIEFKIYEFWFWLSSFICMICFYTLFVQHFELQKYKPNSNWYINCGFFWSGEMLYERSWVVIYYGTHLTDVIRTTWDDIGIYSIKTGAIYKSSCEVENLTYSEQVDQFLCNAKWEC